MKLFKKLTTVTTPVKMVIATLFLTLLILGNLIFKWLYSSRNLPVNRIRPIIPVSTLIPSQPPDISIQGWQYYKDEKYNFSLKYPQNQFPFGPKRDEYLGTYRLSFRYLNNSYLTSNDMYIVIDYFPEGTTPYSLDNEKYFQKVTNGTQQNTLTFDNVAWTIIPSSALTIKENGKTLYSQIAVTKTQDFIIEVSLTVVDNSTIWEQKKGLLPAILSTFRLSK